MAELSQIHCPHCGQSYAVRPEQWPQYVGRTINCTRCAQPFTVTPPQAILPQTAPPQMATPEAPMPQGNAPQAGMPPSFNPAQPPPVHQPPMMMAPAGPGGYPPQPYPAAQTESNGWAIASLICGILGFCIPIAASLAAVVTGIIGLGKARDPRVGGRGMSIAGIILGAVSCVMIFPLMISILLPSLNRAREQANRVKCENNMRMIGQGMMMYANNNGGHFPDKLESILQADPSLSPSVFVCPDDDKTPPSAASIQTEAHEISTGQHCSYIYVGNEAQATDPADTVLLYEPLSNHLNEGMSVLFADGHVEWLKAAQAQSILTQHATGNGPIRIATPP